MTAASDLHWEQPRKGSYVAKTPDRYALEASAVDPQAKGRKHAVVLRVISPGGEQLRIRRVEVASAKEAKAELCAILADHRRRVDEKRLREWNKRTATRLADEAAEGEPLAVREGPGGERQVEGFD